MVARLVASHLSVRFLLLRLLLRLPPFPPFFELVSSKNSGLRRSPRLEATFNSNDEVVDESSAVPAGPDDDEVIAEESVPDKSYL